MTSDETTTESVLAIRMPAELKEKIREAAKKEERTESAFGRYHLAIAADAAIAKDCECENKCDP